MIIIYISSNTTNLIGLKKWINTVTDTYLQSRRKRRDDTVAAIALGAEMPLDISRRIASLTLHPLSRNVGGRKKKRKTMKTRKMRKTRKTRK